MVERLSLDDVPYYAISAFKRVYKNRRFDLLGNSLAIIADIPSAERGREIVRWTEENCKKLTKRGILTGNLPPVLFPFIEPGDEDWRKRYEKFNQPGEYHNGGIWPFAVALYALALITLDLMDKAETTLFELAKLVKKSRNPDLDYGFNEWYRAQTGTTKGRTGRPGPPRYSSTQPSASRGRRSFSSISSKEAKLDRPAAFKLLYC